jgi:hypothetical protein
MARVNPPGVTEAVWVPTIAVAGAPTSAECNGGTDLTSYVRGIPSIPETGNTADTANLSSKFNSRIPASYGGDNITVELWRDDTTDVAYTTLTRGSVGNWVIPWDGLATAGLFIATSVVWVYPCTIISRGMGTPGRDEAMWFISEGALTAAPTEKYTLLT